MFIQQNCALVGYCAASIGNFLRTFRDNLSDQSSRARVFYSWPLKMGRIRCPETSVRNYQYLQRNNPEGCSSSLLPVGSLKSHTFVHSRWAVQVVLWYSVRTSEQSTEILYLCGSKNNNQLDEQSTVALNVTLRAAVQRD